MQALNTRPIRTPVLPTTPLPPLHGASSTPPPTAPAKKAAPPRDPQTLPVDGKQGDFMPIAKAKAATKASVNAALVVNAFQGNIMGKDVDLGELVTDMQTKFKEVNDGNLSALEAMLVGQATALQTMFTSLTMKAANQKYLKNYQSFMVLALKAQAQSRATISALVDLKYPKQAATFVKQANMTTGPQQVNNAFESASENSASGKLHNECCTNTLLDCLKPNAHASLQTIPTFGKPATSW